jgi:hypothetical protein
MGAPTPDACGDVRYGYELDEVAWSAVPGRLVLGGFGPESVDLVTERSKIDGIDATCRPETVRVVDFVSQRNIDGR